MRRGQPSCGDDSPGTEIITFPPFNPVYVGTNAGGFGQIAGILPHRDEVTIDFTDGSVKREKATNAELSQGLASMDAEYVRSLDLYADAPVQLHVPNEEGQSSLGIFSQDVRDIQLEDVRIKECTLKAREPTNAVLIASTAPEVAMKAVGGPLTKVRIAVDNRDVNDDEMTVAGSGDPALISWTPEAVVETQMTLESTIPQANRTTLDNSARVLDVPTNASCALHVENIGTVDVGISAEVRCTRYPWNFTDAGPFEWAPLPGWEPDTPRTVPADENRIFDVGAAMDGTGTGFTTARFAAEQIQNDTDDATLQASFVAEAPE